MTDLKEKIANNVLFKQAVTLSRGGKRADYERLEFLGDRVLGMCVAHMLYTQFKDEPEGPLAQRFTGLVQEQTLADVARQIGIPALLITHENELRNNNSILSDVCEAIIGALFLTEGFKATQAFVAQYWHPLMMSYRQAPKDSKSALQELSQDLFGCLPIYKTISRSGPDHAPVFQIEVSVGTHKKTAQGSSKKAAEQTAAGLLLQELSHE